MYRWNGIVIIRSGMQTNDAKLGVHMPDNGPWIRVHHRASAPTPSDIHSPALPWKLYHGFLPTQHPKRPSHRLRIRAPYFHRAMDDKQRKFSTIPTFSTGPLACSLIYLPSFHAVSINATLPIAIPRHYYPGPHLHMLTMLCSGMGETSAPRLVKEATG